MPLTPGERLGPYEIVARIGAGGMGEVYKARDPRLNRMVAIKVSQERFSERFAREALAAAALSHPNICTLYDVGPDYLVMELLEGGSLASRLEKGPLPVGEALKYASQIASALDAAHKTGMTHRDLKPQNVVLSRTGAKLLDFGLAKIKPKSTAEDRTITKALTGEGVIVGTYQYMAPETLAGKEADARADIFAFGAVLYEMLTGQRAFDGASQAAIFGAILHTEPPPIATLQPLAPPAVDRVVRKCLAKDPEERWQSARDLADELAWLAEAGSQARSGTAVNVGSAPGRRRLLTWAAVALGAAGVCAVGVGLGRGWRQAPVSPPAARFPLAAPAGREITSAIVSEDGDRIAVLAGPPNERRIYIHSLAMNTSQPVPGTEGAVPVAFSPGGRSLAFTRRGRSVHRVDLSSGAVQDIYQRDVNQTGTITRVLWTKPDTLLISSGGIYQVSAGGGAPRQVTTPDSKREESAHHLGSVLPDGRHFLYLTFNVAFSRRTVWVGRLDDPSWRKLLLEGTGPALYDPSSGYLVFTRENTLFAQPFDPDRLEVSGQPVMLADRLAGVPNAPTLAMAFSTSATGVLVWRPRTNTHSQVSWYDRGGRKLGNLGEPGDVTNPTISPDGERVILTVRDPGTRTRDLWLYSVGGGAPSRLTFDAGEDFNPSWSPDGKWIAFSSNRKGHKDLYRRRADGSGGDEDLFVSDVDKNVEHWSPDGRYLVFNTFLLAGRGDLYFLPMADGSRQPAEFLKTPHNEQYATISPNGKWIAHSSTETGTSEVFVRATPWGGAPAGKWQISNGGGIEPRWRADGRELYYRSVTTFMAVPVKPDGTSFESRTPVKLMEVPRGLSLRNTYDVTPDGQRFLIEEPQAADQLEPPIVLVNWPSLARNAGQK